MTEAVPGALIGFIHRLADAAGAVIRPYFRSGLVADDKADESPVTRADREAEAAIRALIADAYPDHAIIGEEHGITNDGAELTWVIDPIDGTKAFLCGKPMFGTLIALMRGGRPVLGLIDQPITGERWVGGDGWPTQWNGRPVGVRGCPGLERAILAATSPAQFSGADAAAFAGLSQRCKLTHWGGDCYNYALLASGQIDLVLETPLQIYDWAALVPVIEQAGGVITDWHGRALRRGHVGRVLAAGDAARHAEALAIVAPHL
ncbi:MAG: histidinol-phosphatase [Thalassobaculales bacterium]